MAISIPFPVPSSGYALNSALAINLQFIVDQLNTFNTGSASWDQVVIGTGSSITGKLSMFNSSNNNYIAFQPGVTGASVTYTLPITAPAGSSFLLSSGADVMSWSAIPTSSLIYGNSTPALASLAIDSTVNKILLTASSNTLAWSAITLNVNGASQGLLYTAAGVSIDPLTNGQGAEGFPAVPTSNIPVIKKMLGTSNQIVVTKNTNDWTLSTPQDIGTSSDVVFGTAKVGNGSSSSCAIKFNATNSGLYNSNTNEWSIAFGGVQKFQFNGDVAPFFAVQGDIVGNAFTGSSFRFNGASSGDIVFAVPATITTHTLTLPSAHGAAGTVLTDSAGNGTLSWAAPGSITGTVNSGTQYQLGYYATSAAAISGLTLITASRALASDANGLPVAQTDGTTATELGYVHGVTSAIQTQFTGKSPIAGSSSIVTVGTVTSGTWAATAIGPTAGGTGLSSYVLGDTIYASASNTLSALTGNITTTRKFLRQVGNSSQSAAPAWDTVTASDVSLGTGASPTFTNLTLSGDLTFSTSTHGIIGTTTNDNAAAGNVGQFLTSYQSTSTAVTASATAENIASITLTAGDWDVWGTVQGDQPALVTLEEIGLSTDSTATWSDIARGNNATFVPIGPASGGAGGFIQIRASVSTSTTYYFKISVTYTGTAPHYRGTISARRRR